jgi:hypothetical protein
MFAVATIAGNTVHIVAAGTAVITASQGGSTLWNPAPDVPQTLTVNNPTGLENPVTSKNSFNIYITDNYINIQTLADDWDGQTGSVKVVDITGKPVLILRNAEFSKNSLIQVPTRYTKGLFIVEIRSEALRFVGKVVVK